MKCSHVSFLVDDTRARVIKNTRIQGYKGQGTRVSELLTHL